MHPEGTDRLLRTSLHTPGAGDTKVNRSLPEPHHPGRKKDMKTDELEIQCGLCYFGNQSKLLEGHLRVGANLAGEETGLEEL